VRICILGASGDIGEETSKALRGGGHEIIECYRNQRGVAGRTEQERNEAAYISTETLKDLETSMEKVFMNGRVECIVNALGIGKSTLSPKSIPISTDALTIREWEEVIYVNLKIPILLTEIAIKNGVKRVVHIGSALTAHGLHGTAMAQAYSASKKGLFEYCQKKNREIGPEATVVCVAPGLVKTKMTEGSGLRALFKGELEPGGVAQWVLRVVEQESIANSVQLPIREMK